MTQGQLRTHVGLLIIVVHLGTVILTLALYARHLLLFSEMTTVVALITPFFAAYTTAVVKFFIDTSAGIPVGTSISTPFALLSYGLPLLFAGLIVAALLLKGYTSSFETFDDFKHVLTIVESSFGVYAGLFLKALFDLK